MNVSLLSILVVIFTFIPGYLHSQTNYPQLNSSVDLMLDVLPANQTLTVGELRDISGVKTKLTEILTEKLETIVVDSASKKGLSVVERRNLKAVLKEWEMDLMGIIQKQKGDKGAKQLIGTDYIIYGTTTVDDSNIFFKLKMVNLEDGRILTAKEAWMESGRDFAKWNNIKIASESVTHKLEEAIDNSLTASSPGGELTLRANSNMYKIGEHMQISFWVSRPLYVTIMDITPDGEVTQIFPNAYQTNNYAQPGFIYTIPPTEAEFEIEITGPPGTDRIKAIATDAPVSLKPILSLRGMKFTKKIVNSTKIRTLLNIDIR
jgi:hypothetical protein